MPSLSPTQSDIQALVRSFLLNILPTGVEVVEGQDNRVPEPEGTDFVVMTAIRRPRLATNIDTYGDATFTGSITGTLMTITAVLSGAVFVGGIVSGVNVAAGTKISSFGTGTGGVGTYNVSPSQAVTSETLALGTEAIMQETEIDFQLDVHGPASADNAQTISTLFRDAYAFDFFAASDFDVTPLHADDPRQLPFLNDQDQVETRWVIEALVQANQIVTVNGQQFAAAATAGVVNVNAAFPP